MKFYTYVDQNRFARIVQTRDARTVNPDENKPDPKSESSPAPFWQGSLTFFRLWSPVNTPRATYRTEYCANTARARRIVAEEFSREAKQTLYFFFFRFFFFLVGTKYRRN